MKGISAFPLVEHGLRTKTVVSEHIAVVAGEEDDGIVQKALFAQCVDDKAKLMVDVRAQGTEGMAGRHDRLFIAQSPPLVADP